MVPILGTPSRVSEVLEGKKGLSMAMAGIPPSAFPRSRRTAPATAEFGPHAEARRRLMVLAEQQAQGAIRRGRPGGRYALRASSSFNLREPEFSMAHKPKKTRPLDPVITEIVRNGVIAVTEEMKTNLMRTAYNMIIYEALDFTVGLFTAEGETVSIGIGLPMFIRGMAETVKAKMRHFGRDGIEPGDIYSPTTPTSPAATSTTSPSRCRSFTTASWSAFSCCMAHWPDIGGTLGGMTTDIFSEGLQIPILKYQDRGKVNQDLVDIIQHERAAAEPRAWATCAPRSPR